MNHAFDYNEVLEISDDLAETIKPYLTADTTDEVLDLEIKPAQSTEIGLSVFLKTGTNRQAQLAVMWMQRKNRIHRFCEIALLYFSESLRTNSREFDDEYTALTARALIPKLPCK